MHDSEVMGPSKGAVVVRRRTSPDVALGPIDRGLTHSMVSQLQRLAGNRAANAVVQRHAGPTRPVSAHVGGGKKSATPAARKAAVEEMLDDSKEGKDAKAIAARTGVKIDWAGASGGGSYFQGPDKVVFDVDDSDEDTVLGYVHEMNHAKSYADGTSSDIEKPKDEYLKAEFAEESEGTVLAIEAKLHTNAAAKAAAPKGKTPAVMSAVFAFESEFIKAYDDAVKALPATATEAEKAKKGREAGYKVIYGGFMDGTIKTSMPGNPSYVKWYGDIWEDHHKAKAKAAAPPTPVGTGGGSSGK